MNGAKLVFVFGTVLCCCLSTSEALAQGPQKDVMISNLDQEALDHRPLDSANLEMDLVLYRALYQNPQTKEGAASVLADLRKEDGIWQRVWAVAGNYNKSDHPGRIAQVEISPEEISFRISLTVLSDGWVDGGRSVYDVKLRRKDAHTFTGTYHGKFKGVPVDGEAKATIRPAQRAYKDASPSALGEHPRVLFRRVDLPRLRKKMDTPLGQAALKALDGPAGAALRYQLTSNPSHAERALRMVSEMMADKSNGSKFIRSRIWGWRCEQIALAYDMCYSAWPPKFRKDVEEYFLWVADRLYYHHGLLHKEISWDIASIYPGRILYGIAIAGLAIWGEKGPAPAKPERPNPIHHIPPDRKVTTRTNAPVVILESGTMPSDWIYVGGFKVDKGQEALVHIGGAPAARPAIGQKVTFGDRTETWRPISEEPDQGYWSDPRHTDGKRVIDITNAIGRVYYSTSCFYTILNNTQPRWVCISTNGRTSYLNGTELRDGDCVRLDVGLYPWMVVARIGETNPWGRILMRPVLVEVSEQEARRRIAAQKEEYEERLADWQFDMQQWQRMKGVNVDYIKMFEHGRFLMYRFCREAIGTGGFQGPSDPIEGPGRYACLYRNMLAADVSPWPDLEHYLARKIFGHVFAEGGEVLGQNICGPAGFETNFYHEQRDTAANLFAAMYPQTPERYRPAVHWAWRHFTQAEESPVEILDDQRRPYPFEGFAFQPLYAFVNYPLDEEPQEPQAVMPLVWQSPDQEWYAFRSGWEGKDDFLTQIYAKSTAWPLENAGTFRIIGLGQMWTHGPGRSVGQRWSENVILLPEQTNKTACGKVVYQQLNADGSGALTIDLSDVYTLPVRVDEERTMPLYERYGSIRRPEAFRESGITGLRAFAVDTSGRCGAPYLLVIVDRIRGGQTRQWAWQLATDIRSAGKAHDFDPDTRMMTWEGKRLEYRPKHIFHSKRRLIESDAQASVKGNVFNIRKGDANLRGFFVAPHQPKLSFEERKQYRIEYKRGISELISRAIYAQSDSDFFCVVTIQRGKVPEIRVDGKGLEATVYVGERRVSFDGMKLVLQ